MRQVWRACVREGVSNLLDLSLSKPLLELVAENRLTVAASRVESSYATQSQPGFKLVIRLADGQAIEAVAIVHETSSTKAPQSSEMHRPESSGSLPFPAVVVLCDLHGFGWAQERATTAFQEAASQSASLRRYCA